MPLNGLAVSERTAAASIGSGSGLPQAADRTPLNGVAVSELTAAAIIAVAASPGAAEAAGCHRSCVDWRHRVEVVAVLVEAIEAVAQHPAASSQQGLGLGPVARTAAWRTEAVAALLPQSNLTKKLMRLRPPGFVGISAVHISIAPVYYVWGLAATRCFSSARSPWFDRRSQRPASCQREPD